MNIERFFNEDYITDLSIRLSHHSTAIEGNKISFTDTATIVLDGTIPNSNIKIRDFYEVHNHIYAINYMFDLLSDKQKLDLNIIKEINKLLLYKLHHNAGNFKIDGNAIRGANFNTATPSQTPLQMFQWEKNLQYKLENSKNEDEKIKAIIESHIEFERIHPFSDGNGRTGRLIMIYSLIQENIVPFVITVDKRNEYIKSLSNQDVSTFYSIAKELQEFEIQKINGLFNIKKNNIGEIKLIDFIKKIFNEYIEDNHITYLKDSDLDTILDLIYKELNITDIHNSLKNKINDYIYDLYYKFNQNKNLDF